MSFFSFQDIISCTTGIMVLITLMLTMHLMTKTMNADQAPPSDPSALEEAMADAKKRLAQLQHEVKEGETTLDKLAGGEIITPTQVKALEQAVRNSEKDNESITGKIALTENEHDALVKAIKDIEDIIKKLTGDIEAWTEEIAKNKKRTRVTLLGGGAVTKRVLFVEASADKCTVAVIPKDGPDTGIAQEVKRFEGPNPYEAFIIWAATLSPDKDCFVLLVRPKAVDKWVIMFRGLKGRRFDVGWDVWPPDKNLLGEQ
ncbi:MAG: hypothetical protein HN350_17415 [Phycisphaerales bacterium]|nr:hypothetical protein [Phycisphaerales bacterium]